MIPQYFRRRRSLATNLVMAGPCLGQFVLPSLLTCAVHGYAVRGALVIYGCCFLQMVVFGALLRPFPRLKEMQLMEYHADVDNTAGVILIERTETRHTDPEETHDENGVCKKVKTCAPQQMSLLREPLCLLYLVGGSFSFISLIGLSMCSPPHLREHGHTSTLIGRVVSVGGVSDLIGRLLCGVLLDLETVKRVARLSTVYSVCVLLTALTAFIFPHLSSDHSLYLYSILFGSVGGQITALTPLVLIAFVGVSRLETALGFTGVIFALAQVIVPLLMGKLFDANSSKVHFMI